MLLLLESVLGWLKHAGIMVFNVFVFVFLKTLSWTLEKEKERKRERGKILAKSARPRVSKKLNRKS